MSIYVPAHAIQYIKEGGFNADNSHSILVILLHMLYVFAVHRLRLQQKHN
jgi:hypothetical protein